MIDETGETLTFAKYVNGLWTRAGCPSARRMAAFANISPQTANELVRRGVAARWTTVAPVLEFLGADTALAVELWALARPLPAGVVPGAESLSARLDRIEAAVAEVSEQLKEVLRRLPGS